MGPASAGSISTARGAPTPGRRYEGALVCLHARGVGRCREVAMLVGEVEEFWQMMESMKRIVT